MLLRRVIEQVKAQNWTAVALDFVIVVVGVFIGIQVSNWNAARTDAEAEIYLINRLKNDLHGIRVALKRDDELVLRMHEGWIGALRALERCEAAPEHAEAISHSFSQYQRSFSPEIQRSAYDEMKATGAFSRLPDTTLQNDITQLYTELESQTQATLGDRENQLAAGRILWKNVLFSFASDDPKEADFDAGITTDFDPLEHCDNRELRGAIWEMVDLNRDWLSRSAYYADTIDRILSRLEEAEQCSSGA